MTNKGLIFKAYAEHVAYLYGYYTMKMVSFSPDTLVHIDSEEACSLRDELVSEGYLRTYVTEKNINHGWSSHRSIERKLWTGLTEKGWDIAHKYLVITNTKDAETEVHNQWVLNNAGLDLEMDFAEYRSQYIAEGKPGWWALVL